MIETYWNKYINEELSESETVEFYNLLKDDVEVQKELLDLVHDEALFGLVSNDILSELELRNEEKPQLSRPSKIKKSHKSLYAVLSMAALLLIGVSIYLFFSNQLNPENEKSIPKDPIVNNPEDKKTIQEKLIKEEVKNSNINHEKLSIDKMKLPVALASVKYPTKKVKNIFFFYSKTLVNYGPVFSNLNLNKNQKVKLKDIFNQNIRLVMGGYMNNIKEIKYQCPLTKIVRKKHKNDIDKEMFVWARAHTAMTGVIEKNILEVLNDDQKKKYLKISLIINKYSDENGHLYLTGSKGKLKKNTQEYLIQLQPYLK